MSDSAERKIKLLLLYEILLKQTDELHPMTTSEIFTALQESGIAVSRQTLYSYFIKGNVQDHGRGLYEFVRDIRHTGRYPQSRLLTIRR